jgi:hypothetical protein
MNRFFKNSPEYDVLAAATSENLPTPDDRKNQEVLDEIRAAEDDGLAYLKAFRKRLGVKNQDALYYTLHLLQYTILRGPDRWQRLTADPSFLHELSKIVIKSVSLLSLLS